MLHLLFSFLNCENGLLFALICLQNFHFGQFELHVTIQNLFFKVSQNGLITDKKNKIPLNIS